MSEFEPGFNKPPQDERDIAAQKYAEAAAALEAAQKAEFDATQKEAFGKFDITAPNQGEDTYQSYLDKRPTEVTLNNGGMPVDTETKKFASKEAYEAQTMDTQDYYDKLGGVDAKQEQYDPSYESMGLLQLAKEAAKARQLGDPAGEAEIKAALEHHLSADALKDDTETPEQAQARYDADLKHYEDLVNKLSARGETWPPHAADTHAEPNGEGNPSSRAEASIADAESNTATNESSDEMIEAADAADETESTPADTEQTTDTAESATEDTPAAANTAEVAPAPEADAEESEEDEDEATPAVSGATYNGKKISVARVTPHPSGDASQDTLTVIDEDGNELTIQASDVVYGNLAPTPGKEVELYQADKKQFVATEAEVEPEDEKKGVQKWWDKIKGGYYKAAGAAFWAGEWAKGQYSKWLDHNVDHENMTPEEQEKKRNTNRKIVIAAGVGLAAIGLGSVIALGVTHALNEAAPDASVASGGGISNGTELGDTDQVVLGNNDGTHADTFNLPLEGNPGVEEVVDSAPNPSDYTIYEGDGGEGVFQRLGIDPAKWYDVAPALLAEAPGDFYQDGGDIRFAHTGQLSQRAQEIINSLR